MVKKSVELSICACPTLSRLRLKMLGSAFLERLKNRASVTVELV